MKLQLPPRTYKIWRAVVWLFNNSIKIVGVFTILAFLWFMIDYYIYTPYMDQKYAQTPNDNPVGYGDKLIGKSAKTSDTLDKLPTPKIFKNIDEAKATYYDTSSNQFYSEVVNLKTGASSKVEKITPTLEKDNTINSNAIAYSSKYIYFVQSSGCNEGMGDNADCSQKGLLTKYDTATKQTSLLSSFEMSKYYLVDSLTTDHRGNRLYMISHNDDSTQYTLTLLDSVTGTATLTYILPEKIQNTSYENKLSNDDKQIAVVTKQIDKQTITLIDATTLVASKTITLPSDSADSDYSIDKLSGDFSRYLVRREPTTEYIFDLTAYETATNKEVNTRTFRKDNVVMSWSNDSKYVAVLGYVKDAGVATIWLVDDNKWVFQTNSNIVNRPLHWLSNNTLISYFYASYDNQKMYFYNPYSNEFTKLNVSNVFPNVSYTNIFWEEM